MEKFTEVELRLAVEKSVSIAGVMRELGIKPSGGSHSHITRRIKKYEIDLNHFTGQGHLKGKVSNHKLAASDILIYKNTETRTKTSHLLRALNEIGREYCCAECKISEYNNKPITLQIDHIDGDYKNNIETNLRFLCPNCHSQTPTYGNKN